MFSFRTIFTAAVALATLASAVPVSPENLTPASPNAGDLTGVTNVFGGLINGASTPAGAVSGASPLNAVNPASSVRRGDARSPGDILKECHGGIEPIVIKIKAIIGGGYCDCDHDEISGLIGDIVVLLKVAIDDLKLTVAAKLAVDVLLTIEGVVCTVAELAVVVYGVVEIVIDVLAVLLHLVINVDVTLCAVLYAVGALLVEIVDLVICLVAGLDIELCALVKAIIVDIQFTHCDKILVLLGITA